jgi:hypothetical protein
MKKGIKSGGADLEEHLSVDPGEPAGMDAGDPDD